MSSPFYISRYAPRVWVNSVGYLVCDDCLAKIYYQEAVLEKKFKF